MAANMQHHIWRERLRRTLVAAMLENPIVSAAGKINRVRQVFRARCSNHGLAALGVYAQRYAPGTGIDLQTQPVFAAIEDVSGRVSRGRSYQRLKRRYHFGR